MSKQEKKYSPTIVTGVCTLDHHALLEPELPYNGEEGKDRKSYKAVLFFDDKKGLEKLEVAIDALIKEAKWDKSKLASVAIRTGEQAIEVAEKPEAKEYLKGKWIITAKKSADKQPGFFRYDRETKGKIVVKDPQEIKDLFYRGAKVVASVTASTYIAGANKGITLYLNNIMFVGHGTRLGGATGDEFSGMEIEVPFDPIGDSI